MKIHAQFVVWTRGKNELMHNKLVIVQKSSQTSVKTFLIAFFRVMAILTYFCKRAKPYIYNCHTIPSLIGERVYVPLEIQVFVDSNFKYEYRLNYFPLLKGCISSLLVPKNTEYLIFDFMTYSSCLILELGCQFTSH